jgi:hypothetical protein
MNSYTVGEQPCQDFKPQQDGNMYATWDNVHECYRCKSATASVSFCLTCNRDHHSNGYETCAPSIKEPNHG